EHPFPDAEDGGIFDSGCSRSMTGNKERPNAFQEFQGRKVTFGGSEDTACLVLSKDFKLPDESMVVLRVPRKHNLYTINLNNLYPKEHKDETYQILKDFINLIENQLNKKVKAVRYDNGTEFKNAHIIEFCGSKGIKREYSNAKTPQQNKVAERKNKTLIEAARTIVLVTSPHNKTPYALLTGNIPSVSHFKPFECHVTILNTSDHLGKFEGKVDEGYIVGYSASNKAYRVYNVPNKRVKETMNMRFLEEKPNVKGLGTQAATTNPAGTQDADSDSDCNEQVIIVPSYPSHSIQGTEPKDTSGDEVDDSPLHSNDEIFLKELARLKGQEQRATSDAGSLGLVRTGSVPVPSDDTMVSLDDVPVHTSSLTALFFNDEPTIRFPRPSDLGNHDPSPGIFSSSSYDDAFGAALSNVASTVEVTPVVTKRIKTIHPQSLIVGDPTLAVQTRSKVKQTTTGEFAFINYIYGQERDNHTDFQHCLFACFLSQVKPRSVAQALEDPSWVDAMQEEMQQFKFQNVWVLVDLPQGKYAIKTKWILKNKRDARRIVFRNKARLVAQGHRQEEGIDYDEVFAPVARIEAIRLFLAFASYMGFMVYQMDVKSVFLYERIDEEVYVTQPKGFVDPQHPMKAWCDEFEALMKGKFQMSAMGELIVFLASRPDIMFAVSACSRNQVTPTTLNLEAVKKIFNDYARANKDRKSTTSGCQFLGRRLISWQCKKQTIMATSSTEAEYVDAANCCGQPNGSRGWISGFQVLYMDQVALF
nr:hypothetical protein [Tanacetum cinerariifolium]